MKYRILYDFGSEGFKFEKGDFDSINDAVKKAIDTNRFVPFLIITIVDWQAVGLQN